MLAVRRRDSGVVRTEPDGEQPDVGNVGLLVLLGEDLACGDGKLW